MSFSVWASGSQGQEAAEASLPVIGAISEDGTSVALDFSLADEPRVGNVSVERRVLGEVGADSWRALAPELGPVLGYRDTTTAPGQAYEYRVMRSAKDIVDVGFFTAGRDVPATDRRGKALLIVDETLVAPLQARLSRFARDLTGDGWEVIFQRAERDDGSDTLKTLERADGVRTWIRSQHQADPFDTYAVILVGALPYVMAGPVGPDGHGNRLHATDLFYADTDGQWGLARDESGQIFVANRRLPSDWIEMQIGRIDFSDHKADNTDEEHRKLRAYFDKNHHWRNGFHGDLREAYWDRKHLLVERDGLLNIVGRDGLSQGGHHDLGEEKPWLWGADFGSNKAAQYIGNAGNKAAFVINFGSHKQRIERANNTLRASLAQPWYTVAAGWGARPAWRLHHMALGGTIGEAHLRTVNNGRAEESYRDSMEYFPTGRYLWRNPIWVNLLGDPTLRAFMLAPPHSPSAKRDGARVALGWSGSPDRDTLGYHVYRSIGDGAFEEIAQLGEDARSFIDETAPQNARYMIRAKGIKNVAAGSFFTLSQAAFAIPGTPEIDAPDLAVEVSAGAALPLPLITTDQERQIVQAPIAGASHGRVSMDQGRWIYIPDKGFAGEDQIRYTTASHTLTEVGTISITVNRAGQGSSQ
ncbi:MAG: Ig-like domain-containing protein [Pseudomonadota bacterium]